jgi:hypothetical protein
MLSDYDRKLLKKEIKNAFNSNKDNYDFKLGINFKFDRKLPDTAKSATFTHVKALNASTYQDCKTV